MKVKLLKRLRKQALANLDFMGSWDGYWYTYIDGIRYESGIVSGFKYIIGDTDTFIQDAIISHCKRRRTRNEIYN